MIRVLINGVEAVNQPNGLSEATERLFYDPLVFGYRQEMNVNLSFFGEDFTTFYQMFSNSTCSEISVEIQETDSDMGPWRLLFKGLVYTNDITFDIDARVAKTQVIDDSFVARMLNYDELPINLFSNITKNGEPASITTSFLTVRDHTGAPFNRELITQFDVLDFIIRYLTDNAVQLESDFLTSSPADKYFFVSGNVLRNGGVVYPEVQFGEILRDLCRVWHLRWVIINVSGQLKFKLESFDYFNDNAASEYINDFAGFEVKSNDNLLVSSFTFGSYKETVTDADDTDPWILAELIQPWAAHTSSSISSDGNCAVKKTLALSTTRIIYDSNTISAALNSGTDKSFDDDIYLVNTSADVWYTNTGAATPINNKDLTVGAQLKRWLTEFCFVYPISAAGCDDWWDATDSGIILSSPQTILIDTPIVNGCYWTGAEILHIRNANGFTVELYLEIEFSLDDNPPGSGMVFISWDYLGNKFIKPYTGWTNTGATFGEYVSGVSAPLVVGDPPIIYAGTFNDIAIGNGGLPMFLEGATNGPIGRLTPNSYIKVYHNSYQAFQGNECRRESYEISSEGYLSPPEARGVRNSRFDRYMLPNSFRTYTGTIAEYSRNITSGKTNLTINAKGV